jgi:predicted benzoate:H+ symporter BenE
MSKTVVRRKENIRVILPDSDKLGLLVASFCATLVMAINFIFSLAEPLEIAYRVALTFAASWAATAALVHYLVSALMTEARAERAAKRRARAEAERAMQDETDDESALEGLTGE